MKPKVRMKKVGRVWIDKKILDEGYDPEDIIDTSDPVLELPELLSTEQRRHVGWMLCPECGEQSQVDRRDPVCSNCGWEHGSQRAKRNFKCAA